MKNPVPRGASQRPLPVDCKPLSLVCLLCRFTRKETRKGDKLVRVQHAPFSPVEAAVCMEHED